LPVGLAVEHEFVGCGVEPVDGGLGEQGVGHVAEPLTWNWHTFDRAERAASRAFAVIEGVPDLQGGTCDC
jgi:hypothetical protein